MDNLSHYFFILICWIAFINCLPSPPNSPVSLNHAHRPRSNVDGDFYIAADPGCSSNTTPGNKIRGLTACPNPDSLKKSPLPPSPARTEPGTNPNQEAQPASQGPSIPWKPRNQKYDGCNYHLLCGRGLKGDEINGGALVNSVYLCRCTLSLALQAWRKASENRRVANHNAQ